MGAAADFFIKASEEENGKVYVKVLKKSADRQMKALESTDIQSVFSSRLKSIMKAKQLSKTKAVVSMRETKRGARFHVEDFCRYSNKKRMPNLERLFILCDGLNISADYLLGLSDDPSIKKSNQ